MGYPLMKNYLLAKTCQYMFPWMDLTLASIVYVAILHLIFGVMNILSTLYILANGIEDYLISLMFVSNSAHSFWALLMCHMSLSSSAFVDE